MSRRFHVLVPFFFAALFFISVLTPSSSSQSTLRSLALNGTTAYLDVPNHTSLNITGPITVEAWIRVNTIDGNFHDIVSRSDRNTAGSGGGYALAVNNVGKVRMDLFQAHNQSTNVVGATVLSANTWYHVAGVFSGTQLRVYVNGVLDGSLNTTNAPVSGNSLLRIGRAAHASGPPLFLPSYAFAGLIDEVRVSAAALYTSNFTAGLGPGSNVRGLWKFDGQTSNDFSGNGNHGTLIGGANYSIDVPPATNNAPTVSLIHPLSTTAFAAGSNLVMDATATDGDGSVAKVDFYQGTTLLGTDTTAPYSFVWTNVPIGSYSLTAKATDDGNASTTSTAIEISVLAAGGQHSLALNGTTAYVDVPNHTSLNITGPITVEAWIRVNTIDGNFHDIVSRSDRNTAGSGGGYALAVNNVGKVRMDLFQAHNQSTNVVGATVLSANTWYHVAGVFSGTQLRVYVNGVLDGSLNTTNAPVSGNSLLRIGRAAHASGPPLFLPSYAFAGLIDEVRVSAAALYTSNFTAGLGPGSNVRGLWKFDGQTLNDFSGNSNHGTLVGGATYSIDVPPAASGSQRPVPVAGGPYSGQLAQPVQFSSSGSFDPDGTIASFHWNFGDGTSSTSANPAHTYAAPGLYTATLTVTDNAGLKAGATALVTVSNNGNARLDPLNHTGGSGENPLSRNFNWTLPLVTLPGRAGMDLGLSLSYNSLVWTKSGNYISFDDDRGFPGPGFRLGFPVIQPVYYNSEVGKYAFLLIGPDGGRTELRQVGSSALYEAADSSYLLLDASTMILRSSDGTQFSYTLMGSDFNCTQIKDRNGNYITINYTPFGRIDTVIDTLARSIKFNYGANGWLTSITQIWNQGSSSQVTHNWATFTYSDAAIQTNFTGLTVSGPSTIKALSKVTLADGSHFDFSYTSWGQVWKVSSFAADNHLLNHRSYNLPLTAATAQTDCPRFTERRDWAQYWNGDTDGTVAANEEAVTTFIAPVSDSWTMPDGTQASGTRAQVTTPDGTVNKIYFLGTAGTSTGWRRGLPALVNTYDSESVLQRQVMTTWTQDNTSVSYQLNPRVTETNTYDPAGNRARTGITYQQHTFANGTSCQLPRDLYEYEANATTKLRSTRTDYNTSSAYTDRRIIGLVSERRLYEGDVNSGGVLKSKVAFNFDESGSLQGTDAPIQHDNTNYTASFVTGRANLSSVKRYDVTNTSIFTTTRSKYNTAGAIVSSKDALNHEVLFSYADSFSDNNNSRNTLAYPTTVTDPDGFSSTAKYHFDFGARTNIRTPQPNLTTNTLGPSQTITFDPIGRPVQIVNSFNNASTTFEYNANQNRVDVLRTIEESAGAARSFTIADGHGRIIAKALDHPDSDNYSGQRLVYDVMGRIKKTSNRTETSASGAPLQWAATGDDAAAGWIYTEQSYDWKGRPLVTTNPSMTGNPAETTTVQVNYAGCGCAGGQVVTVTDEGTMITGAVLKKRQQKIYSDVLGRVVKTEILNWDGAGPNGTGGSVYSATTTSYNVHDQVTSIRRFAGTTASTDFQDISMTYDGYGRLKTQHIPEQQVDPNNSASSDHTTWNYNDDDTVKSVVDARGVIKNFTYNARHQPALISFNTSNIPSGANVAGTVSIGLGYDAAGNRTSLSDGSGSVIYHYDQLSRMDWEERMFAGLPGAGAFRLNYEYTLGGVLKKVTDQRAGTSFTQTRDKLGRVTAVNAVGAGGAQTQFASQIRYWASGGLKSRTQASNTLALTYNSRGLVKTYSVAGVGSSYEYHDDGTIKFVQDQSVFQNNSIKDRAYSYDAVGRLAESFSGIEAREFVNNTSGGTPDGPYHHTYVYDPWDNMLNDLSRFWSRDGSADANYDSSNRNPEWTYDATGNLLSRNELTEISPSQQARYNYDAAGREISNSQTRSHVAPDGIITNAYANAQVYDGDGNLTSYEILRDVFLNGFQTASLPEKAYLLRSSVLGGLAISEYSANGTWNLMHVYAGSERIGQQGKAENGSAFSIWYNADPVTGDSLNTVANGSSVGQTTLDDGGVNVGDSDPFPVDGSADADGLANSDGSPVGRGAAGLLGASFGRSRCVLDGVETDCVFIRSETSVQCPNNDCGPRQVVYQGQADWAFFRAFGDGYSGFVPSTASYIGNGALAPIGSGTPRLGRFGRTRGDTDLGSLNGATGPEDDLRRDDTAFDRFLGTPQNQVARVQNCATPNSIVELFQKEFEAQWERTKKSGEENGSLIFYEQSTNQYPRVELSEGKHDDNVPSLPESRVETRKAISDFRRANRNVYFLAFFHTHPDYSPGDSRSGKPSGGDIQYQTDFSNTLGIIRTSNGYSFFSKGRSFDSKDVSANNCIWNLNQRK